MLYVKNLLWICVCFYYIYIYIFLFFCNLLQNTFKDSIVSEILSDHFKFFRKMTDNFYFYFYFYFFFLQMHAKDKGKINGKGFLKYQMSFTWVRVSSLWQFVWKNATIKNSFNSKNHFQYLYGWIRDKEK